MANETTVGELCINLKMKLEGIEKGLETAQKKLQNIEQQNINIQNSNKQLETSFITMSVTAVIALNQIKSAIKDGIEKYKEYESANKGLQSIVKGQGLSFNNAQSFIEDYISDGLIPLSDATLAYKNLASRGYNEEQIKKTMIALKDVAAFGRQSTLEYGYAIASATEGIKNFNPVLVDNAGVTKNMSVMYDEYAKTVGKTAATLTDEEKILAEVNGIQEESKNQIGDAAKYAETYAGSQAQVNAVNVELSKTIGESLIPALTQYNSLQLSITKGITELIKSNKTASSGIITLGTGLLSTVAIFGTVKTALLAYTKATGVANRITNTFTASLMANPLFWSGLIITTGITALNIFVSKQQESIDKMNEETEKAKTLTEALQNTMNNDGIMTKADKTTIKNARNEAQEIVKTYENRNERLKQIEEERKKILENSTGISYSLEETRQLNKLSQEYDKIEKELVDMNKEFAESGRNIDFYKNKVNTLSKGLEISAAKQEYATLTNQKAHRETLINIAQTKADIQGKQQLLNILKEGKTTTEAYANAKSQLVKVYPELAKVNENTISSTQAMINAESDAADAEWINAQMAINASILEVTAMMNNSEKIITIANATRQSVEEVTESLQNQINVLANLSSLTPSDFKGSITPSYTPKISKGSTSYSNKALDNYKKQIEHKKALDQLSTQQEIQMYEYALRRYARTADEKNEIREKIYELNKELANKEKEILEQQTEDYETYIQQQKNLRGSAYDITEQTRDYNKIIQMHKSYLSQIMKDERLSLDERKQIYREELQTIRDYEQQKRDLRVEQIDNTVSQLTNAITKQLEEMQEKDKEFIDKQIEEIEKLKEIRINAINAEYDAKIEAIEKELEALDKAEQQKSRDEEDAEYEKKKKRLEELVAFEHDATTKANYQKELDKLLAEYQKTLDNRALEDKKEALNAQKDLLQEEQDNKVQAVEDEVEKQKELYNKQLEDLEKYYDEQLDIAQETAEKMLLNVEQNQNQIINLLKSYGNAYEITGQTLGEKLAQGINEGLASKIENIISKIQNTIDAGIENKLAQIAGSVYKYEAGANKPQTKTINVTQQNYIEQNPEMPSETYRKLRNVSEKLAEEFAGM